MDISLGSIVLGFIIGGLFAGVAVYIVYSKKAVLNDDLRQQIEQKSKELSKAHEDLKAESELRVDREARYQESEKKFESIEKDLIGKFSTLSLDALSKNSAEFLNLAEEKLKFQTMKGEKDLEGKKGLIDKSLSEMEKTLSDVKQKIEAVSKGNTEVTTLIKKHEDVTLRLKDTTEHLREALASSKKRGEWGERMAEDIINLIGMVEGVNYIKQKTMERSSGRPDFTFFMPNHLKINMDVKFPLDNYIHYLDASSESDRKRYKDELLKNIKTMIKQVTTRDYINPEDNTVDYVLVFIPNEQVYGFIHESDRTIMDEALKQKVVLCSPFTLYAMLAVVRQGIENFNLEQTASEMLNLLGDFSKQWNAYKDKLGTMGKRLDDAKKEYDTLITTRTNMLERPLKKIDELRKQKAISVNSDIILENDQE
ncbi:MAG TPA: DNA recombination protein RmuC [Nitrospirae bacterium]|nr:DNA recombination protein RmuC [bacterium BMS3Abin09]GBE41155.1 DNA recombination protein RmuC [bacterium BMS3Bbin09]HDZ84246.1 DNA recombination protein RmuC [Nitrospirota bacterium]